MSDTGLEVFDTTVQKSMAWISDLAEEMHWDDRQRAYLAVRGCLDLVRDSLTVEEAAHLSAQLPMLLRGLYFEGWDPTQNPPRLRTVGDVDMNAASYFPANIQYDHNRIIRTFAQTMARHIDPLMVHHISLGMPKAMREMWQDAIAA